MKYIIDITSNKSAGNKNITTISTVDNLGNPITYDAILKASNLTIPTTWEEYDQGNWNPAKFTGTITTIQALTNAAMMGLTLEEFTKNIINFHTQTVLQVTERIEITIL